MTKHKYTTVICVLILIAMLALTVAFMYSPKWGVTVAHTQPEYADKLFSTDKVHTIDIVVKDSDWEDMLVNAQAEEYIQASVVIDGETVSGVGIRPKGNSSLSMIANTESDRYSFKIEFDHFSESISYYGLDKLALNNIAQDNTYMKDYISYQMMNEMGADAPLSSFIWVTVNGEDWGLYLAAEGVEESFAQRVYGSDFGEIYKPDTMDMNDGGGIGGEGGFPKNGQRLDFDGENGEMQQKPGFGDGQESNSQEQKGQMPDMGGRIGDGATSLIYSDDDPDSYSAIFDNAVFDTSEADKKRLIESLKQLNAGGSIEQVVDVDEVVRYFVVHNFVLNSDSYTGSLTHNYYLAENDGKLSMIAWDYNLAFGGMEGGGMGRGFGRNNSEQAETTTDTATTLVNYPIDTPMLAGSTDDKPMLAWIFNNEEYLAKYHEFFNEYMEYFNSGKFAEMYDNAITLISSYVEKDPSAFCTYEEFQKGSAALRKFCLLRAESISGQLDGTIASTSDEQTTSNNTGFIDASTIDIKSMGSNSMGFGGTRGGQFPMSERNNIQSSGNGLGATADSSESLTPPNGQGELPGGGDTEPPDGQADSTGDGNISETNAEEKGQIRGNGTQQDTMKEDTENKAVREFSGMGMRSGENDVISTVSASDAILLLVCVMVLICGILFAKKRYKQ